MDHKGILEQVDGRKLTVGGKLFVLRKGVDESQYVGFMTTEVSVEYDEEKGFNMVKDIKPVLPVTEVEKAAGPVDMAPSANVPALSFSAGPNTSGNGYETVTTSSGNGTVTFKDTRSQKDHDIMRQWAMGNVLQSRALAGANDAIALNTVQTIERAKKLAEELIKWVVTR